MRDEYNKSVNTRLSGRFNSFQGTISEINHFYDQNGKIVACYYFLQVENANETVTFFLTPETYYADCDLRVGDAVIGYYRADAPSPLIYPPQYTIRVLAKYNPMRSTKADYFDCNLISSDGGLKLNISDDTRIVDECGEHYYGKIYEKELFVIYGISTRSIPAITTPYKIVVLS